MANSVASALKLVCLKQEQLVVNQDVDPSQGVATNQVVQKISPAQIRAWVTSGQPLSLPGFQPQLLPVVHMGARWIPHCLPFSSTMFQSLNPYLAESMYGKPAVDMSASDLRGEARRADKNPHQNCSLQKSPNGFDRAFLNAFVAS